MQNLSKLIGSALNDTKSREYKQQRKQAEAKIYKNNYDNSVQGPIFKDIFHKNFKSSLAFRLHINSVSFFKGLRRNYNQKRKNISRLINIRTLSTVRVNVDIKISPDNAELLKKQSILQITAK